MMIKGIIAALLLALLAAGGEVTDTSKAIGEVSADQEVFAAAPAEDGSWQDAYAALLRETDNTQFYLCDIDGDGIPELFAGGTPDDVKYAEYDVYTFDNNSLINIGGVSTLKSDTLELDHNHGILSYDYGAGEGGMNRFYKENHKLCENGMVYGYYYSPDGQQVKWFRDEDGNTTILSKETEDECRRLWGNELTLECYNKTEDNIEKVIYGWGAKPADAALAAAPTAEALQNSGA